MDKIYMRVCLRDSMAAECFYKLIEGEGRSRSYYRSPGYEYGYFLEEAIGKWIAFDNRMNAMFIATCRSAEEAEKLLTDGDELFSA